MLEIEGIARVQISCDCTPNPSVFVMEVVQHLHLVIVSVWIPDTDPISHSYVERFVIDVINIDELSPSEYGRRTGNG